MDYMVNRWYDPSVGEFVSVDPLIATTGQAYEYGSDDPVTNIDPLGLSVNWNPVLDIVHTAAKDISGFASTCAFVMGITGQEEAAGGCEAIALLSGGVAAATGGLLADEGCESVGEFASDIGGFGLAGVSYTIDPLSTELASESKVAENTSNWVAGEAVSADVGESPALWAESDYYNSEAARLNSESTTAFVTARIVDLGGSILSLHGGH
jgi:hypothetical protein